MYRVLTAKVPIVIRQYGRQNENNTRIVGGSSVGNKEDKDEQIVMRHSTMKPKIFFKIKTREDRDMIQNFNGMMYRINGYAR